ncbi:uncharacterized protein TRIVIDRAFT_39931 [Trichoderma virens Gv29-8]|uniref:Dienelactone hydrolase domain-containing protein n=1 Tax=Hypocrea virens (strain Gv29-8 / FGSC 10586) TaxID=413071 RepID=G9NBI0_HYPVG|nr:uncharacterized protein TRIVIDRAFT_39931 [Trichoderma virens Gv29-8]EHK16185.1 hypothetical protein TRIVIDRAFT_39931 [Trichoderma virens Gv29-8]UKZ56039.1 hypothetical protein TrVGV298_009864 [Trichoderma virens]
MSCPSCFSGHAKSLVPTGRVELLHGRNTYISEPGEGVAVFGIVVIVPDAFGWEFPNNRLLADEYARQGSLRVYLPDFMDGAAAPVWMLQTIADITKKQKTWLEHLYLPYHISRAAYGFIPFIVRNRFSVSMTKVQSFIEAIRHSSEAHLPLGAAGFCWGGLHVLALARGFNTTSNGEPLVNAVFTAHPSNVKIPDDVAELRVPVSLAIGDKDFIMPVAQIDRVREVWASIPNIATEVRVYPGAGHGFSVRADPHNAAQAAQSAEAERQAVAWFQKHFHKG